MASTLKKLTSGKDERSQATLTVEGASEAEVAGAEVVVGREGEDEEEEEEGGDKEEEREAKRLLLLVF